MAINWAAAVEDEKRRKQQKVDGGQVAPMIGGKGLVLPDIDTTDVTGDTLANAINSPIDRNAPSSGYVLGAATKGLKNAVQGGIGAVSSGIGDAFNKVGGDISAGYSGTAQPVQSVAQPGVGPGKFINTRPDRTGQGERMIGGNSPQAVERGFIDASLSPRDAQLRDNIKAMDATVAAGVDPATGKPVTNEQLAQIQQIKQQAGFLRGGTDRGPLNPDGTPMIGGMRYNNPNRVTSAGGLQMDFPEGTDPAKIESWRQHTAQLDEASANPIAQKNSARQDMQWKLRNGYEVVPADEAAFGVDMSKVPPENRLEMKKMLISASMNKDKASSEKAMNDVTMQNARIGGQAAQYELNRKKEVDNLLAEFETADPKRQAAIDKKLKAYGVSKEVPDEFMPAETYENGVRGADTMRSKRTGLPPGGMIGGVTPAPEDPTKRVVGKTYSSPKGMVMWNGKTWDVSK